MPRPVRRLILAAVSAFLALSAASVAPSGRSTGSAAPALTFSTPTIVDPFRQGFEPNVAFDPHSGALYSSVPNGTPGTSTLWRSDDGGHDWRIVEGNTLSEPSNCLPVAGGDTELAVDPVDGSVYYSDLQPLTNFNQSVSHDKGRTWTCNHLPVPDTGVDRQWFAIDSNGATKAVSNGGVMYFEYDDTTQSPSPAGGNVLVVNATENGLAFGSVCTPNVGGVGACAGPSVRVTLNEGLPGNLAVDDNAGSPHQHSVYALHSSANLGSVILSRCDGGGATDPIAAANYCLDPTAAQPPFGISSHWSDHTVVNTDVGGKEAQIVANNFTTLAVDTGGNLYALWSQYPGTVDSTNPVGPVYKYTGTGRLLLSHSSDGGTTWSAPQQVNPPSLPNNTQPWLTAGDPGRVAVAWYGAPQATSKNGEFGPDTLNNGVWDLYVGENLDTLNSSTWNVTKVSDHPAKLGNISTEGLVLTGSSPDRSLGDFTKIGHDSNGALFLVYVDDNTTLSPILQNVGPVVFSRQIGGPSLLANKVLPQAAPRTATTGVSDPVGDAVVHIGGQDIPGPPRLDITGASVSMADDTHLRITMTVNEPNLQQNLGPDPTLGGATADAWLVRWDFPPGAEPDSTKPGAYFVAMENSLTGGQTFYDGAIISNPLNPVTPSYYTFSYPSDHKVQGSVSGDTITWIVPVADVGSPKPGDSLYAVQAFTAAQAFPNQPANSDPIIGFFNTGGSITGPNLVDQAPAFASTLRVSPASNSGNGNNQNGGNGNQNNTNGAGLPNSASAAPATRAAGATAVGVLLVAAVLGAALRRRRTHL